MKNELAYFQLLHEDFATFEVKYDKDCIFRIFRDGDMLHVRPVLVTSSELSRLHAYGMDRNWNFRLDDTIVYHAFFSYSKWKKIPLEKQVEEAMA